MINHSFVLDRDYAAYPGLTGIDEAGRGCLAGPVVVAAVTWDHCGLRERDWFDQLDDSKKLSARTRDALYPEIISYATRVRVAVIGPIMIDYLNILRATLHGFELVAPAYQKNIPLCIDGNQRPVSLPWAKPIVKGDQLVSAIAGAAIVAKVTRDRLMHELAVIEPGYGFEVHKGYATAQHRAALAKMGPSAQHRKSFRPVSELQDLDPDLNRSAALGTPAKRWQVIQTHYHRLALETVRQRLEDLNGCGLQVLPSAHGMPCIADRSGE